MEWFSRRTAELVGGGGRAQRREGKGDDGVDVSVYICPVMFLLILVSPSCFSCASNTSKSRVFSDVCGAGVVCYYLICFGRGGMEMETETGVGVELCMCEEVLLQANLKSLNLMASSLCRVSSGMAILLLVWLLPGGLRAGG